MSLKSLLIAVVLVPVLGFAQTVTPAPDFSPPPMVPAAPPPMPPPEPTAPNPGTPPPPGPTYIPGQQGKSGYTYSPYGQPKAAEKPGPEVGLMVTESLFGILTAAGTTILPYFLLFANAPFDDTILSVLMVAIFGLTPLAVSQTMVGIANGSRHYQIEGWIPTLIGLGAEGLVLTIYYFVNGKRFRPVTLASTGGVPPDQGAAVFLFIGSIGLVPLIQMAAINLFKGPKQGTFVAAEPRPRGGLTLAPPTIAPLVTGNSFGGQAVFSGSF